MYPYRFGKCVMPSIEGVQNDVVFNERYYSKGCCQEYKKVHGKSNCDVRPITLTRPRCVYKCPIYPIPKDICR